jgi:hypothetical protein
MRVAEISMPPEKMAETFSSHTPEHWKSGLLRDRCILAERHMLLALL